MGFALLNRRNIAGGLGIAVFALALTVPPRVDAPLPPETAAVAGPAHGQTDSPEEDVVAVIELAPPADSISEPESIVVSKPAAPVLPAPAAMPERSPSGVGLRDAPIVAIDDLVRRASAEGLFPGAAVVVARDGAIVKRQAYGDAVLYSSPTQRLASPVPAHADTIFDIASLTKLFTASAIMRLVDKGAVALDSPVSSYVPEFARNGKGQITVKHLLTHMGGLPEGVGLPRQGEGRKELMERAYAARITYSPGTKRIYSDIDFMLLGEIVERAGGNSLDRFIAEEITGPLGMTDTMYQPPSELLPRIAATEQLAPRGMVRGSVHDTVTWYMGGVSGHAGLFSTASDLAVFGQMMLGGGEYAGRRILSPESVAAMTRLQVPASFDNDVGLGWELNQSWYMGGLNGPTTYGHTGYTGTSLVVSPRERAVVVVLTNRVHPVAKTSVNSVRRGVADLVASSVMSKNGP